MRLPLSLLLCIFSLCLGLQAYPLHHTGTCAFNDNNKVNDKEVEFFAAYESNATEFHIDDSIRVNIVVYSSHPFRELELKTKRIQAKGGTMRLLPSKGLQQQRVKTRNGVYYAIVFQSYIVSSQETGTVRLPEMEFEGEMVVYDEEDRRSPFDPFGFFHTQPRKSHTVKQKCKAPAQKLEVKPKPKRSTQEIISSGARVI